MILSHSSVVRKAANELATVLLHTTPLQKLDLSYNNLSASDAVKVFKGLKNISNLMSFNISHNAINNKATDKLANVLFHNPNLQELDLGFNNLSISDAVKIFKEMKNISNLMLVTT